MQNKLELFSVADYNMNYTVNYALRPISAKVKNIFMVSYVIKHPRRVAIHFKCTLTDSLLTLNYKNAVHFNFHVRNGGNIPKWDHLQIFNLHPKRSLHILSL